MQTSRMPLAEGATTTHAPFQGRSVTFLPPESLIRRRISNRLFFNTLRVPFGICLKCAIV